jgi:NADH:ubiquinone oxidoreductase subunit 5 (subunit L)/multisubunit Na+/H+ antiporter MnhA subunit
MAITALHLLQFLFTWHWCHVTHHMLKGYWQNLPPSSQHAATHALRSERHGHDFSSKQEVLFQRM